MNHQRGNTPNTASRKAPLPSAARALFVGLVLVLSCSAALAGDPIPGLDVKLGKNPGGIAVHATTDNAGRFVFDNLTAGQYVLSVNPPLSTTKQSINTTRSNIKGQSMVGNGVQVVTASVQLGAGSASADIDITAAKGKITGTVTRAEAPVNGATPAQHTSGKATTK